MHYANQISIWKPIVREVIEHWSKQQHTSFYVVNLCPLANEGLVDSAIWFKHIYSCFHFTAIWKHTFYNIIMEIRKKSHAVYTIQPFDFVAVSTMNALLINVCVTLENACCNAIVAQMHEIHVTVLITLYICENIHAQQSGKTIQ